MGQEGQKTGAQHSQDGDPGNREGKQEGRWAIMDYGDVIVHIFYEETRRLYSLEQLWSDGSNITHYGTEESVINGEKE